MLQIARERMKMLPIEWIPLRGEHNLQNVLAACAIAAGATIALPAIQTAIEEFEGVSHRLQLVATRNDVKWYDDSIATTPERSLAALKSFDEPIILLWVVAIKTCPGKTCSPLPAKEPNTSFCLAKPAR